MRRHTYIQTHSFHNYIVVRYIYTSKATVNDARYKVKVKVIIKVNIKLKLKLK